MSDNNNSGKDQQQHQGNEKDAGPAKPVPPVPVHFGIMMAQKIVDAKESAGKFPIAQAANSFTSLIAGWFKK